MNPLRKLRSLVRKNNLDAEMQEEMRAHVEMQTELNIAAGMNADEARYAALRQFGNVASLQERAHEQRGWVWLEQVVQDTNYAVRRLRKSPGFAFVAIMTLALCIAANIVLFSLVRAILLRPYTYPAAERVVNIGMVWPKWPWGDMVQEISPLTFIEIEESARSFSALGFIDAGSKADLHLGDRTFRLDAARVTPGVWSVARVRPVIGRVFDTDDLTDSAGNLAVLSYDLWSDVFNRDPEVIGREIQVDDRTCQVVGVMPAGFSVTTNRTRLWLPKVFSAEDRSENGRGMCAFQSIGRLRDGVSIGEARDELKALYAGYLATHPEAREFTEQTGQSYGVAPLSTWVSERSSGPVLLSMQLAAGLVLLLGCLNIAGLLLVRGHQRLREIALRSALGASRRRIASQLAIETLVLFLFGGVGGVLLAVAALGFVPGHFHLGEIMPYGQPARIDGQIFGLTLGVSLFTGLLAGSLPIFFASRANLSGMLQALSSHTTGSRDRRWAQSLFVIGQMALAMVLLTGAGITIRNLNSLLRSGFGVVTEHRLVASVALPAYRYGSGFDDTQGKINPFKEQALERIGALPGVLSASVSNRVPLSGDWPSKFGFQVPGYQPAPGEKPAIAFAYEVYPGYFETLGMPLFHGRDLASTDTAGTQPVVVISRSIADRFFANGNPVGERISFFGRECAIVGVVGETQNVPLSMGNAPAVYLAARQWPLFNDEAIFIVHTALPADAMAASVLGALSAVDPLLSVRVTNLDRLKASAITSQSTPMKIAGSFATVAILLTAMGLYGVLATSVVQRTKELAIRVALGAQHQAILRSVLFSGGTLAGAGCALGALAALPLVRWVKPLLATSDATRLDVMFYSAAVIMIVALLASYMPARRAAKVDPIVALRAE